MKFHLKQETPRSLMRGHSSKQQWEKSRKIFTKLQTRTSLFAFSRVFFLIYDFFRRINHHYTNTLYHVIGNTYHQHTQRIIGLMFVRLIFYTGSRFRFSETSVFSCYYLTFLKLLHTPSSICYCRHIFSYKKQRQVKLAKRRFKMNTLCGGNFWRLEQNLFEKLLIANLIKNFLSFLVSDVHSLLTRIRNYIYLKFVLLL